MVHRTLVVSLLLLVVGSSMMHAQTERKRDVAILFDNSGSMFSQIGRQRDIAKAVVAKFAADSTISIYGFAPAHNGTPFKLSLAAGAECSSDLKTLEFQLKNIEVARGQTILLDGIVQASERFAGEVASGCVNDREKILILLSDGEDRASSTKPADLIKKLKDLKVKTYVIGLLDDLSGDSGLFGKSSKKKSKEFLTNLSTATDGRLVIAKRKSTAAEIVAELLAENYSNTK